MVPRQGGAVARAGRRRDRMDRHVDYVSPGYETIWGRTREAAYASPQSWVEAIHAEDRERVVRAALTNQVAGTYDKEYRIVRPDGTMRWVRDRAFPVRDADGQIVRVAGADVANAGVGHVHGT